ncbi:hypothetical protein, partial [Streptomyces scabiei]|uniref:hypothetical protein n=1 Tax=Streptomyces scabiei TaxID=1930 RepID=UPI0029A3AD3E
MVNAIRRVGVSGSSCAAPGPRAEIVGPATDPPPGPGPWLGVVALTLVGIVVAGFLALLVPLLA